MQNELLKKALEMREKESSKRINNDKLHEQQ